ncbi:hypothetical protein ABPG75_002556 [Micractinium tetrahymenae]
MDPPRRRERASFWTQAGALARKQASLQKRRWLGNLGLLAAPFLICMLLWVLQEVINKQLDSRSFRCGCKCLACCDWVPVDGGSGKGSTVDGSMNGTTAVSYQCYEATDDKPCSPYAKCQAYNDTECGLLYSTADQVGFCGVAEPPLWPALLDVPQERYRGPKAPGFEPEGLPGPPGIPPSAAPMLYTGEDPEAARQLMQAMWARAASITDAVMAAYLAAGPDAPTSTENSSIASEAQFVEATGALARGLVQFDLSMGTSAVTSMSLLLEPAFVSQGTGDHGQLPARSPLYFALPNCSALSEDDAATLGRIGESITNLTGFPVECASLPPAWQVDRTWMNDQVYCGWANSQCVLRHGAKVELPADALEASPGGSGDIQEYVSALYDWHNTSSSAGLRVNVWVNDTNVGGGQATGQGPPDVQRWSQAVNLAANAYLKRELGPAASARLVGVKDMPKGSSRLSLDFSSLLGPLFSMWLLQLMLPVGVHSLVHEKEAHLRVMMKMQGLSDAAFYFVMYAWAYAVYCAFVAVFCTFGGLIGLRIFTLNSYSLQAVFYLLWGLCLTSWSFYFSALWEEARPAVLLCVIWVIISGFMANLVMTQYIEQGPVLLANLVQLIPSFNLFRGLYELSQYAFLADRTGGSGLTWGKLLEPGNGMISVLLICGIESIGLMVCGYYIEQVNGAGTGVRRHPLFFLGFKMSDQGAGEGGPLRRWLRRRRTAAAAAAKRGGSKPGKQQASAAAPAAAAPALDRRSSEQSLREQWQGAGAMSAAGATSAPASSAGDDVAAGLEEDWAAQYYGSYGSMTSPALHSPQLPALAGLQTAAAAAGTAEVALTQVPPCPPVPRKPTSLRLAVAQEPSLPGSAARSAASVSSAAAGEEEAEGPDVAAERARAEALWQQWQRGPAQAPPAAILLRSLRKVFPSRDGNAEKVAVADLSLAIQRRECFGLLGPNGAGKTTTIRMLEGFMHASSGQAVVEGYSIASDMDSIYTLMGACPQHDLLWEGLTGREHLLFYARVKNLTGRALRRAVDDALRSVNLFAVGNELVGGYSGGMKRRLSVAISLVGDPQVVYLDEPSTGLDPASRQLLWNVIRAARKERAVVLTTHSMEEAEALCDRLGIFVGGRLQCVGQPQDLISRFGGYLSFYITTPPGQEAAAAAVVRSLSPSARLVSSLGGCQKFELPVGEAGVDAIFARMEAVKARGELSLIDWGVSNATLEEVFVKITRDAGVRLTAFA